MAAERGGTVRTTYYGRLHPERPAYTISTYFSRPGNGCNIHPFQDRTISIREAARLQSFPDSVLFPGTQASQRRQIGNAVPPLLGRAVASAFPAGNVVDLFCGVGGLSLGFSLAGHKVLAAVDSDADCISVHRQIHPECQSLVGDVNDDLIRSTLKGIRNVDLVIGGPPCQGWSYGGWHTRSDPRNALVWSFIEIVNQIQPKQFLMENVQGLMWMERGAALRAILQEFGRTYAVNYFVLNAADFGVPQLRRRVFIVGTLHGTTPKPPVPMLGPNALPPTRYVSCWDAIGDLPPIEAGQEWDADHWVADPGNVPYRQWCRGALTTEEFLESLHVPMMPHRQLVGASQVSLF